MSDTDDLRCIIRQLDLAAKNATAAAQTAVDAAVKLALDVEDVRLLAAEDRVQISRLILLMQRLAQGTDRLEQTAAHVAEDLAASINRADHAPAETPGAGADAALRSPGETAAEVASHLDETAK